MERLTIDVGAIVQHFKRNDWLDNASEADKAEEPYMYLYRIENVAYWADNVRGNGLMIVYQALYGNGEVSVRSLEEFLCKVDAKDCGQGYRFVRYDGVVDQLPE